MNIFNIRKETTLDSASINHINRLAFGGDGEARLVDSLRDGGFVRLSLIAEVDDQIVGHILFSDLLISTSTAFSTAAAVTPFRGWARSSNRLGSSVAPSPVFTEIASCCLSTNDSYSRELCPVVSRLSIS